MTSLLVGDLLEHAVAIHGSRVALADGDTRYTYREASERVRRLAAGLLGLGLTPGDHVAVLAGNSHRYWEAYFASHYAGTVLVPLNTRLAAAEIAFTLRDARASALLVAADFVEAVAGLRAELPDLRHVIALTGEAPAGMLAYERLLAPAPPLTHAARHWREDDMINLFYTSGTTGRPRGVMLSQRNVVANAQHGLMNFPFLEDDVWLHAAPMFHVADAWACYALTAAGARHTFMRGFSPAAFAEVVRREKVTLSALVPAMIGLLVDHPGPSAADYASLRLLVFGGAPMPVDLLRAARRCFGPILCQGYGMTEAAPMLASQKFEWLDYDSPAASSRLGSVGREVVGVRLRVCDAAGRELPPGEVGELTARGANVMLGYWRRPEETRQTLRDGWLHTGDLGRIDDDGFVHIVGRLKDLIITGGENVSAAEVEAVLCRHPAVAQAAVIGLPDRQWGEAVAAVVVPRAGGTLSAPDLIAHCRRHLAGYKCPRHFAFVHQPLPQSGTGKVLKAELHQRFAHLEVEG
ncbi:MAG: long-chain-fatty-acid--CoA ligase [Deltaproteobacteria bacterium]|nr:long-chain-fatty-acid--CoA ligase [Deltaproteobacteria bacterium]